MSRSFLSLEASDGGASGRLLRTSSSASFPENGRSGSRTTMKPLNAFGETQSSISLVVSFKATHGVDQMAQSRQYFALQVRALMRAAAWRLTNRWSGRVKDKV